MATLSKILLITSVMILVGCGETSSTLNPTAPASAIIVLPGYYGTRLAQVRDHDLVWISTWEALFGSRSLVLPLDRLGLSEGIELEAAGILSDVPVLPFYSVDAYGTLLDMLHRTHGRQSMIVPFAYDWRGDVLEAVKQLHQTVTDLRKQGVNRIGLVAHSMGGLIAAYYLRYGTQELEQTVENWAGAAQVDAVVLAGVPYGGSMFTFRNMQYGRKIGLNKALLSSEAVASFPSSYYLLPSPDLDVLLSASLDPLRGMIYDSSRWKENEWGLLRGSSRVFTRSLVESTGIHGILVSPSRSIIPSRAGPPEQPQSCASANTVYHRTGSGHVGHRGVDGMAISTTSRRVVVRRRAIQDLPTRRSS